MAWSDKQKRLLSARCVNVLEGLTRGMTYAQIAVMEGVSERTVQSYVQRMKAAWDARTVGELLFKVYESAEK